MLSEKLRECGVVGAGGAGFPTHVKAQSQVEFVTANGAECEPLIHKDAELMKRFAPGIVAGDAAMMQATGAPSGKFGVKSKNAESIEALKPHLDPAIDLVTSRRLPPLRRRIRVGLFRNRPIDSAGRHSAAGRCVVNNVETLYNVSLAEQGTPVTEKFLSACGAVKRPKSFWAP